MLPKKIGPYNFQVQACSIGGTLCFSRRDWKKRSQTSAVSRYSLFGPALCLKTRGNIRSIKKFLAELLRMFSPQITSVVHSLIIRSHFFEPREEQKTKDRNAAGIPKKYSISMMTPIGILVPFFRSNFIEKTLPLPPPLRIYFTCMYMYVCWLLKPSKRGPTTRPARESFGFRTAHPAPSYPPTLRHQSCFICHIP